jgi:exosortase
MSTTTPDASTPRTSSSTQGSVDWKSIAIPYAVAILAQLPMLLLYARNLHLDKPHYQTFPIAILATLLIAWNRWPKEAKMPFHRSVASDVLLVIGLMFGIACVLFKFPSAAAASVMLLIASLLARTVDKETLKSLWPASLPMFVFLSLPGGYDVKLITTLQRFSAICTSRLLDLVGLGHHMDGTVIQVPGREGYGIEQACSGVQSFFTLLFIAVVFIVVFRRPFFRSVILIVSAVFWALFMNTVRIFLIPMADQVDLDLTHGFPHAMLGWCTLIVGALLLLSTDQFLLFLFGPVDTEIGRSGPFGRFITKFWNSLVAGGTLKTDATGGRRRKTKRRKTITQAGKSVIWGICGLMALAGVWSSWDVFYAFVNERHKVRFFDVDVTQPFEEADLPAKLDDWNVVNYKIDNRERGSDLGKRSDKWTYRAPNYIAQVSLDQTFPGWHELTTCYRNSGWELVSRVRKNVKLGDPNDSESTGDVAWPYVVAEFKKPTGERGFLAFSLFNTDGAPVDPPASWNRAMYFISGIKNRLSGRIRTQFFNTATYQIQTFVAGYGEFGEDTREEVEDRYLRLREITRQRYVEKTTAQ